ncbi:hypothetical protein Ssi03_22660 [Sphaerisporangium siamense]|uniref:Uncharacterized protein n=1 Tax=Sphaerisporangium siamense TaxID=795645 RepID=A0A7W7GCA2_9ACTN|nr:hypothetical protein [Sphaerisporangium siamense]MBB4701816.1 hypothetical protein [Sphaerisporangium siamense]GII84276.1 hypothetical protein Ssi03_22660 [Sphaerisporangium siamense]
MRRLGSTVVVVVGERAAEVVGGLDGLHNVRAIRRGERAVAEVTDLVVRAAATYVVHDADPLGGLGEAWTGFFDESAPAGGLEVAIESALADLRDERVLLPDYYLVLDPDDMPATRRHWWLGVLAGAAPSRVVPTPGTAAAVTGALGRLSAGPWWPADLEGRLRALPRTVPDRAGLPTA